MIGLLDDPARAHDPTLRPYRAALARLLPSWAEPDAGIDPRISADPVVVLAEGLLRLLRLAPGDAPGCVLRLEDLHWADDDTLALVEHLASAAAGSSVLLACSARDDAPAHAARRLATAPGTITLHLARLGGRDVAALAAACRDGRPVTDEEAEQLLLRSDGLPFAVEELLAAPGRRSRRRWPRWSPAGSRRCPTGPGDPARRGRVRSRARLAAARTHHRGRGTGGAPGPARRGRAGAPGGRRADTALAARTHPRRRARGPAAAGAGGAGRAGGPGARRPRRPGRRAAGRRAVRRVGRTGRGGDAAAAAGPPGRGPRRVAQCRAPAGHRGRGRQR